MKLSTENGSRLSGLSDEKSNSSSRYSATANQIESNEFGAEEFGEDEFGNDELSRRVSIYLKSRHFDSFRELDVDVRDGAVTISGKLDSFYQKQVAINSCQRVAGVVTLIDQITVSK